MEKSAVISKPCKNCAHPSHSNIYFFFLLRPGNNFIQEDAYFLSLVYNQKFLLVGWVIFGMPQLMIFSHCNAEYHALLMPSSLRYLARVGTKSKKSLARLQNLFVISSLYRLWNIQIQQNADAVPASNKEGPG